MPLPPITPSPRSLHVLERATVRVAQWPVEALMIFDAPMLADDARHVIELQDRVDGGRLAIIETLHAAIPRADATHRRLFLDWKRRAARDDEPYLTDDASAEQALATLEQPVRTLVVHDDANRRELRLASIEFDRAHRARRDTERQLLRNEAGRPAFQRALAIASPDLVARWTHLPAVDEPARARHRRLEASVFLYLSRAVGRATPQGAWAGVAPLAHTEDATGALVQTGVRPMFVAPSLVPFAAIARAMGRSPRYRQALPLRANPTLRPATPDDRAPAAAGWDYELETGEPAHLEHHPVSAALIAAFAADTAGVGLQPKPVLDAIAVANGGGDQLRAFLDEALDALVERDVVRSTFALPARAETASSAIAALIPMLLAEDRAVWDAALATIEASCETLSVAFDDLDPGAVLALVDEATAAVQTLWTAAGLPAGPPLPVLTFDRAATVTIELGPDSWRTITDALDDLVAFHQRDGAAERYRRWTVEDLLEPYLPPDGDDAAADTIAVPLRQVLDRELPVGSASHWLPVGRDGIFRRFRPTEARQAELAADLAQWTARLEPVHRDAAHTIGDPDVPSALDNNPDNNPDTDPGTGTEGPGLGGDLLLHLDRRGTIWWGSGRPQPGLFTSRLASLLGANTDLRAALHGLQRVTAVDVIGSDPVDPGTALRPALTPTMIDAGARVGLSPATVQIVVDRRSLRPLLRPVDHDDSDDDDDRNHSDDPAPPPWLPVYPSGAAIGRRDAWSRVLLGLALAHGWELISYRFPALPAEAQRWGHLPRLVRPNGAVISRRRWTLPPDVVRSIAEASGADRYLRWRAEADRRDVPALAHVTFHPQQAEVLVPTSSTIAVDVLFDRVVSVWGTDVGPLTIEELPGDPQDWLVVNADGGHHFSEIAVTWIDPHYGDVCDG